MLRIHGRWALALVLALPLGASAEAATGGAIGAAAIEALL